MAECQRCRLFQADFEAQERQHKADEAGWRETLAYKNECLDGWVTRHNELERQLVESQRQNQQLQQQLDAMRESKQAAERAQCNADYTGSIGGRG